jgi:PTS system mannose-specific IIA component
MIRGIIIGHGDFARTMLETAERIVGKQENVEVISNLKLSCEILCGQIKEIIETNGANQIIFVDLPGGSCAISCLNMMKSNKSVKVLCGVNLPMLIEFFLLRDKYAVDELVPLLIKKGRDNIIKLGGEHDDAG